MISTFDQAMRIARLTMSALGCDPETAVQQLVLSDELRAQVREALEDERLIRISDPYMILDRERAHVEWLPEIDPLTWVYWPRLRDYFIGGVRQLSQETVRSVDDVTDRILGATENPRTTETFKTRGLVLGYVQSGKTTNYSALMAKAADVGFKLFIVLSGVHDLLRLQTQRRLANELISPDGVAPLDAAHQWLSFTESKLKGDFNPGTFDASALTVANPGLMVVKKNVHVLNRLLDWLDKLPAEVRKQLSVMIIDDEADQATPNTGGNRPGPDDEEAEGDLGDDGDPSKINEKVRLLVNGFTRVAYIAYTATPFANVFIDHKADDLIAGDDLYPRDFIIDLPQPHGYFGAERIFGRADDDTSEELDIIRLVPDEDVDAFIPKKRDPTFAPHLTESIKQAFDDFVLAGAAMYQRGRGDQPASMLVHTSYLTAVQQQLTSHVTESLIDSVKDDWRYDRKKSGVEDRLRKRWESDFRRVTRSVDMAREVPFEQIRDHITTFLQKLEIVQLNSGSDDELDYDRDTDMKVVVIGGNRLSRGLTLVNLLVSYYVRPAMQYDTLMQMGRWFGYRDGYDDLTRIYTTSQLAQWFRDLATVELELREEIAGYDKKRLTPLHFGPRVRTHPALLPTSRLKMKATEVIQLSFDERVVQTITFPFEDTRWLRRNLETTRGFLGSLGTPTAGTTSQPIWREVPTKTILAFLDAYQMDPTATRVRAEPLRGYIRAQATRGELTRWTVAVVGRADANKEIGGIDLGIVGSGPINALERTRIKGQPSLKAIISTSDEKIGLDPASITGTETGGAAFRRLRPSTEGLLLIYPISKHSGHGTTKLRDTREPIYAEPDKGEDIIGVALSFPKSENEETVEYLVGSVGQGPAA